MSALSEYRAWLARRVEDGSDLDRVRAQLKTWRNGLPHGLKAADLDTLLAELDAAGPKPKKAKAAPPADTSAFD